MQHQHTHCNSALDSERKFFVGALLALLVLLKPGPLYAAEPPHAAAEPEKAAPAKMTRNEQGNVVITLAEGVDKTIGLKTSPLAPARLQPQARGFGRVIDGLPLATLVTQIASLDSAVQASESELKRLRTLAEQNNASARNLQTAEATAARDRAQLEGARLQLTAAWGNAIADRKDLAGFAQSLVSLSNVLVQVNLPIGEPLENAPGTAEVNRAGEQEPVQARLIGRAPVADPQLQTRNLIYLVSPNTRGLAPGAAVSASLPLPGEPREGVVIPRDAVVRHNGAAWVYLAMENGSYKRVQISVDRPFPSGAGWFQEQGFTSGQSIVTTGAQLLLSEELKGSAEE